MNAIHRFVAIATLKRDIRKMNREMEREGIENALDWSRWDEYESALMVLAEYKCGLR